MLQSSVSLSNALCKTRVLSLVLINCDARILGFLVLTASCKARTTITRDVASHKHMARIYIQLVSQKDIDTLFYVPHTKNVYIS